MVRGVLCGLLLTLFCAVLSVVCPGVAVWATVRQFLREVADTYHVFLPFRHVLKWLAIVSYGCNLGNIYGSFRHPIRQGKAAKMALQ